MVQFTKNKLAQYIDHTLLKPYSTKDDIKSICNEAIENNFVAVCILPIYVEYAKGILSGTSVKLCSVVGFPLGSNNTGTKVFESKKLLKYGCNEIDMVLNLPMYFDNDFDYVEKEIKEISLICKNNNAILKVIIETCLLNERQKIELSDIVTYSGADYIKTSTGFSTGGATVDDVALLRNNVGKDIKVKASGGIKDLETTLAMINAGAERIGTSSGIYIINELYQIIIFIYFFIGVF